MRYAQIAMRRLMVFPGLLLSILPAAAATLRTRGTLHGDQVRISDIWDGTGAAGDTVLGPGPEPGASIRIGNAQLDALARAYGIDWRGSAGGEVTLSRPGVALSRKAVIDTLGVALDANGASDPAATEIRLFGFEPPMIDLGAPPTLTVDQMNFDQVSGRFMAVLLVTPATGSAERLRVSGAVFQLAPALLAGRRLQPGTILASSDLILGRVPVGSLPVSATADPTALVGRQLRRPIAPGQPVGTDDVVRPLVVMRRSRVLMALHAPGLDVAASGEATQDGAIGDMIEVRNESSGALLLAAVTGPGTVSVAAGSLPAKAAGPQP